MAFSNFWRGDRERERPESDRDRDRGRWSGGQWRNEGRGRDFGRDYERERESRRRFGSPGWSPGGEYYADRGRFGSESYGRSWEEDDEARDWGRGGRDWDWDQEGRRMTGERGYYGGRGAMGYGVPRREPDYGRQSTYGHGEFDDEGEVDVQYGRGQYRGRGPRNYRRSDERIREDVCDALTDDPMLDASNMEVTVKDGEAMLSGTVRSRQDKRRAEDIVERISGVRDVHNSLRVSTEPFGAEVPEQKGTTSSPMSETPQTSRH